MENLNPEVSLKVKSAIKAKLMELGAYVDDELPDYIMILVGNKKTKEQMHEDLNLFLGQNTERFTSWLHAVLQKLNAASMLTSTSKSTFNKEKDVKTPSNSTEITDKIADKKKHKKKKDKSEKKKEKKEKKKKKEKRSSKRKREIVEGEIEPLSKEGEIEPLSEEVAIEPLGVRSLSSSPKKVSQEEDLNEDVVNLRPDAADLALDLDEEEMPAKKKRVIYSDEDIPEPLPLGLVFHVTNDKVKRDVTNDKVKRDVTNDKVKRDVTNDKVKRGQREVSKSPSLSETEESPPPKQSISDKLRPISSSNRIINLREESSFPPSNIAPEENGIVSSRVASSAIASVVRTIGTKSVDEVKSSKRTEVPARARPLVSSRGAKEEALPPRPRLVSNVAKVVKRRHSSEDDSDASSEEPAPKKLSVVASKVEVAPRPRRTKVSQANSNLILRAVADAHKSVSKSSKRAEENEELKYKDKKELFTRSYQERKNFRKSDEEKSVNKFAQKTTRSKDSVHLRLGAAKTTPVDDDSSIGDDEIERDYGHLVDPLEDQLVEEGPEKPPHMELNPTRKNLASTKIGELNTRFIITMDGSGNDSSHLKARLGENTVRAPSIEDEEEEFVEEVEEWEEIEEELPLPHNQDYDSVVAYGSKLKLTKDPISLVSKKEERCKFWPLCNDGDSCIYIHPSKMCTTFPKCRFGDKCLYIHPKCKFNATCANHSCPFTHSGVKQGQPPTAPTAIISLKGKYSAVPPKCRYFPKCSDMNCPFTHPKNVLQICRYGKVCRTANCQFIHPEVPSNTALKWTAPRHSSSNGANNTSGSVDVLTTLSKKIEDLNSLVKKTEQAQVNEELNKLKEMTALLESSTT